MKPVIGCLDPDFRPKIPTDAQGREVEHCARCRRRVNTKKARKAWVNWETWEVSLDRAAIIKGHSENVVNEEFIGPECWDEIGLPPP